MALSAEEIATRTPVWSALADLYLDTTQTDATLRNIARRLLASPYSTSQLEQILFQEVHPVCRANLKSIAGEWAGFAQRDLVQAILHQLGAGVRPAWPDTTRAEIRRLWARLEDLMREAS